MGERNYSRGKRKKKSFLREIKEWIITIAVTMFITLFIIANIFSITGIMQYSMEPSFSEGDRVLNYKLGYVFKEPEVGDVIIFNKLDKRSGLVYNILNEIDDIRNNIIYGRTRNVQVKYLIKRVIAIPGDIIDIVDGSVYVNGEIEEGDNHIGETYENKELSYPLLIPEGKVFVLGDNRENSSDSRNLGLIDYGQIVGKVTFRIWPISKIGKL